MPQSTIRSRTVCVLVVTECRFMGEALCAALQRKPGITVRAYTVASALTHEITESFSDAIALIDAPLPGGAAVARVLVRANPDIEVVPVIPDEADHTILAWASAGARSYVRSDMRLDEVVRLLASFHQAQPDLSPRVAEVVFGHFSKRAQFDPSQGGEGPVLTSREEEILQLLASHRSNKEIASELGIRVPTVKNHVRNIFSKLGIHRRVEAATWAAVYKTGR